MSFKVEKIIYHKIGEEGYSQAKYVLDKSYLLPFFAGKFQALIPYEAKPASKTSTEFFDKPFFNESGLFKVVVEIGQPSFLLSTLFFEIQSF